LFASIAHAVVTPLVPGWIAHTIVTGIPSPAASGLTVDPLLGDLYAATGPQPSESGGRLRRIAPDGTVTTLSMITGGNARALRFGASARVLYWSGNGFIQRIDLTGVVLATIPQVPSPLVGNPIAIAPDHQLYAVEEFQLPSGYALRLIRFDEGLGAWT